jgi:DNA-binding CsgD family transcriptional regulator
MNEFKTIRAGDVRSLLDLIGELYEFEPEPKFPGEHVLRRLLPLTGSLCGTMAFLRNVVASEPWQTVWRADMGWRSERHRKLSETFFQADPPDPMRVIASRSGPIVTSRRRDLVPDLRWNVSPHVGKLRREAGVDDCIYSLYRLPEEGCAMGIFLHRGWGSPKGYELREEQIVHLLQSELGFFYRRGSAMARKHDNPRGALAGRPRQVLDHLLTGAPEKRIARNLSLSEHTVHTHIRAIYRRFCVNSRGELLAMFLKGTAQSA